MTFVLPKSANRILLSLESNAKSDAKENSYAAATSVADARAFKKEKLPISVAFLLEPNLFLDSNLSDSDSNEARDNLDETDRFNSRGSIYQTTDL